KAPKYIETLNLCGLRTHSKSGDSFLDSLEIMLIANLLRVISNPALDIELLSVLMSPVFGFDANDLARMRSHSPRGSLYAALIHDAQAGNKKSTDFLSELRYYREMSVTLPLSKLINLIYERASFMTVISAMDTASSARNNLRVFHEYARNYEQNTHKGLSAFINYLDRLSENKSDLQSAAAEDNAGSDAITVMSMHSSKGLEFPVVILAEMSHGFVSDTTEKVLLHPRYGYVQKRFDKELSVSYNTMPYEALSLEIKRSELSEELRILYVALTRARQKLIAVSTPTYGVATYLGGIMKKLSGERNLTPYIVRSANSMSDWLTMCAMLHPDGAPLRGYIDAEIDFDRDADFRFDCAVIDEPFDEITADDIVQSDDDETPVEANRLIIDELTRHAEFVYPYEGLNALPVKVAASTLAHRQNFRAERYLSRPAFLSNEKLNSAEKGTALHAFMQFADFAEAREDIKAELDRLVSGGFITGIQADSIDLARARAFIDGSIVSRCLNAEAVYKEYRFNVRIPAHMVSEEIAHAYPDETVILQGAVDLAFVENGELVIVDYKTDRVKHPEQLREMYATQLMLYKEALTQCLGLPVKECTIYSVRHSAEVEVYHG
ncbi:MAG: PD-(D/E)XK nuclease family protein, partial [Ruminococcus sp.]|nr:PD-(D/E)XK nuclease family protein [Ruminococcus sp.]